ncbi:hypothetical protein BC832DRAFT_566731 [Gaertneriomyces semiglobifer]|nr:hypothetical protein BC832DRAFT_566731 [Gaertneriomyces semiglobifer]
MIDALGSVLLLFFFMSFYGCHLLILLSMSIKSIDGVGRHAEGYEHQPMGKCRPFYSGQDVIEMARPAIRLFFGCEAHRKKY